MAVHDVTPSRETGTAALRAARQATPATSRGAGLARVGKIAAHAVADSPIAHVSTTLVARLCPPRVRLTRYDVVAPRLPAACDGLRVLHLSDLHLRPGSELAWQISAL